MPIQPGEYTYSRPGIPANRYTLFCDLHGPRTGLNAGLARPSSRDASPASASPVLPVLGAVQALRGRMDASGETDPDLY